jgi:DNA-binding transcriptional LysR family regulator
MQPANVPDLTARQLHAVLAVAEYNSFIAAAAFLKTSQPALTRTIKRVEDVLGVRLFDRSTRRVVITAAGKEFVAVAERMLNDLRISVSSMRDIGQEQRGQIIISSIMSVATGLLPAIVAEYRSSRPGIDIVLREGVHGTVLEDIRSGTADLGATYVDDLPDFVEAKRLSRELFNVILPRTHPLAKIAKRSSVTLSELVDFPLVSLPYESRSRRGCWTHASPCCHRDPIRDHDELRARRDWHCHRARWCGRRATRQRPDRSYACEAASQQKRGFYMVARKGAEPSCPRICEHLRKSVARDQ